jgi:hypothetical protein
VRMPCDGAVVKSQVQYPTVGSSKEGSKRVRESEMVSGLMRGRDETPDVTSLLAVYWSVGDFITSPEGSASDIVRYATESPSLRDEISRD